MTALVVYESMFGNTRDIADAVAHGLAGSGRAVELHEVGEAGVLSSEVELLVVGGPTHAFSMSRESTRADARTKTESHEIISGGIGLREWIEALPRAHGPVPVAVFDTKVRHPRLPGSAAKAAAKALKSRGYRLVVPPETFDVDGMTGPLLDGERHRARIWGESLAMKAAAPY